MRLGVAAGMMALALAGQPSPARAQMESREAIALQNQLLQLRQEMEQLRARGGAVSAPATATCVIPRSISLPTSVSLTKNTLPNYAINIGASTIGSV